METLEAIQVAVQETVEVKEVQPDQAQVDQVPDQVQEEAKEIPVERNNRNFLFLKPPMMGAFFICYEPVFKSCRIIYINAQVKLEMLISGDKWYKVQVYAGVNSGYYNISNYL